MSPVYWKSHQSHGVNFGGKVKQGSYGLLRDRIDDSKVIIKPEPGELIIFNAQRIHAVREVTSGKRVTMSTFIGYRGTNKPLTFFS